MKTSTKKKIMFVKMLSMFALIVIVNSISCLAKKLTDKEILTRIYEAMNGPVWEDSQKENWLTDKPIGEWKGVETNDEGRVISLEVLGQDVNGLIPAEIGGLTELERLIVYSNVKNTQNIIPAEIGKLTKLKHLNISAFSDLKQGLPEFPDFSTLVNLEKLSLIGLGGAIPEYIAQLSKLHFLDITGFEGEIPESIGQLSNLEKLYIVTSSQPVGEVPESIRKLTKLVHLRIDYKSGVSGKIEQPNAKFPEWIWELTNLEFLHLNSISNNGGHLPGEKVAKMNRLKDLVIINCGVTGAIPAELFAIEKLNTLNIYQK